MRDEVGWKQEQDSETAAAYSLPIDPAAAVAAYSCGSWVQASTLGVEGHCLESFQPFHHNLGHSSVVLVFVSFLPLCFRI